MTLALTVRTKYRDITDLVMHLAQKLEDDGEMLVLACANKMPKGEWVKFNVCLADGISVLEGVGRVHGARERGKKAALHERFDVQIDTLQFDEKNEVMWERIQLAAHTDRSTGEVDLESIQTAHELKNPPAAAPERVTPAPAPPAPPPSVAPPPPPPAAPVAEAKPPPLPPRPSTPPTPAVSIPKPGAVAAAAERSRPSIPPEPSRPSIPDLTEPSIQLPQDLADRVAALVPKLEPIAKELGLEDVSRTSVTRLALAMGVAALEAQLRH